MKKLYTLLLVAMGSFAFGQTIYSENMGVPTGNTNIDVYVTQAAPATFQNGAPIVYTGTGDMRTTVPSSGYTGASGGGNVFLNTDTEFFQIDGLNTSAYASADIQLSFGHLNSSQLVVEYSTNGTNWTGVTFTSTGGTWALATIPGGVIPSSATLSLKFRVTGNLQTRLDDVKLVSVSSACALSLGAPTTECDAVTLNIDTYTATIAFTGGGTATYNIASTAGTISGDDPSTTAEGNIIITGLTEGTGAIVTVTGGSCNLSQEIMAASCKAINVLPVSEHFNYAVGSALGAQQSWVDVNTGDNILIAGGSLSYTGIASEGNSATFTGSGIDNALRFTETTEGKLFAGFLMTVADYSNVTTDGTQNYFAVLTTQDNGFRGRLFMKKVGEQYQIGLASGGTSTENYTATSYNVGDVLYIVMGYDFTANQLSVWVNPTVATFTEATPATLTDTPNTPFDTLGAFMFRQDSNTATPTITVDALRIATSLNQILGVAKNQIEGLAIYPNPVTNGNLYINTTTNDVKDVVIYDVLGKQVLKATVADQPVNVSSLNSGVYVVKITEAGKTATRKLVIR